MGTGVDDTEGVNVGGVGVSEGEMEGGGRGERRERLVGGSRKEEEGGRGGRG